MSRFDTVIKNATVIDGSGADAYEADIAVRDGLIVQIAPQISSPANSEIDASGLVAAPGFIDMHSHSDCQLLDVGYPFNKISQGITSELCGHCGLGAFPLSFFQAELERKGLYNNMLNITPHGPLRELVSGDLQHPLDKEQMAKAKDLLRREMNQGSFGISSGLVYNPGLSTSTEELIDLCSVLKDYGGIYFTHMRSEGDGVLEALDEAIRIGREAGVQVHISHLKIMGAHNYDKIGAMLAKIDAARASGVKIWADQYPYTASLTSLKVMLPDEIFKDESKIRDTARRESILEHIRNRIKMRGGADNILLYELKSRPDLSEKKLSDIAAAMNLDPAAAVLKVLQEDKDVGLVSFSMSEDIVRQIMARRDVAVGTDGTSYDDELARKHTPHPREYGTFTRVLDEYVRNDKLLSLENAIAKMTALPAHILGISDFGTLAEGSSADIVLFEPDTIAAMSTYEKPKQYSSGIRHILINGRLAVKSSQPTRAFCGKIIKK